MPFLALDTNWDCCRSPPYRSYVAAKDLVETRTDVAKRRAKEYDDVASGHYPNHAYGDALNEAMPRIQQDVNDIAANLPNTS